MIVEQIDTDLKHICKWLNCWLKASLNLQETGRSVTIHTVLTAQAKDGKARLIT